MEIVIITDSQGRIQYVNPAFEKVTGYTRVEAVGNNPRLLKSGQQNVSFYVNMWQVLSSGQSWQGRFVNRRKNGNLYTEDATISPVRNEQGEVVNYVGVKRDITQELAMEAQYRQVQKMDAIGQLTGGVAHDFNNLLQVINGCTDLALQDIESEHPAREILCEVLKAGHRAARLVSQLLLFSRRQVMQPEILDLNEVIEDFLKMLRRVIGEQVIIEWHPADKLGHMMADRGMIEQSLMNLCVNARDAMPQGGTIQLETHNVVIDENYQATHAWTHPGSYSLLTVSDTGTGMTKEVLDHAFEPFFTTKTSGKGTGLGLATVYGIIKQHHGAINVYSEPGKGSVFKLYWPQCDRKAAEGYRSAKTEFVSGNETILFAEDDVMVRNTALIILERAGYKVIEVKDGEEAVEVYRKNAKKIDLVVLDVVMPRSGGRDAYERMRFHNPGLRALFISGYGEGVAQTGFVLDEGLSLLQKPYTSADLLRMIRSILNSKNSR